MVRRFIFHIKSAFFILSLIAPPSVQAGPLESLSALSKSAHTLSTCPDYKAASAHTALSEASACVTSTANDLSKQGLAFSQIQKKVETNVEDRFFSVLANQHANELVCASQFADQVQKGNPVSDKLLTKHLRDLRTFKLALNEATENLTKNPQVSVRVCPMAMDDLNKDYSEAARKDPNYQACAAVISARIEYQKTLAAIPLAQFPSAQTAFDKYAISKNELSNADLEKLIHSTYKNVRNEILKQAEDIRSKATNDGGVAFNRNDRRALISDPRLVEKVLNDGGNNKDLKGVACSADARYGSGAENLDTDLFVGSLAVSGGMIIKAVGKAAKIASAANTGRALGTYSLTTSNIIKLGAISGLHSATAWNEIEKACSNNTLQIKAAPKSSCADAPSIEKMQQENCYLAATTAAMMVTPSTAVAGLTSAQNKMEKALRSRALEAKIQARQAIIKAREENAVAVTPPTTTPTTQTAATNVTTLTPKKAASTSDVKPTSSDNVATLTSRKQLDEARRKKEEDIQYAALEKEAEDMRAAGFDEYEIHYKQMRDKEVASLKAEGLYTTKPPTGTRFESGSFVKGGDSPFTSKAGDINLVTAEELKLLERHNAGTVVYNYKTGKEHVLGIDDFDKDLLKLKIGGKFSQWGFKVEP